MQAAVPSHGTVAALAAAHGLKTRAVFDAIHRGIITRTAYRRPAEVVQFIPRECLCCGKAFNAETRFIRSCEPCRAKGSPLGDWGMGLV